MHPSGSGSVLSAAVTSPSIATLDTKLFSNNNAKFCQANVSASALINIQPHSSGTSTFEEQTRRNMS
jgi:hypothetical protein